MKKLIAAFFIILFAFQADAQSFDLAAFRMLPVLHEGRIKPLDSYARIRLKEYAGRESINGMKAAEWLAETLFNPSQAMNQPLFYVPPGSIKTMLALEEKQHYFSFSDLQKKLQQEKPVLEGLLDIAPENLTSDQKQLLQIQDHLIGYGNMLRSFSMILPLQLPGEKDSSTYLQQSSNADSLMKKVQKLVKKKGFDPAKYTAQERKMAEIAFGLQQIRGGGEGNRELRVITGIPMTDGYAAPWEAVIAGADPKLLDDWKSLALAYRDNNNAAFTSAANNILQNAKDIPHGKFRLEIFYNSFKPFHIALLFYALALAALILRKHRAALAATMMALATHIFGIAARIFLLGRPPVGTLYEAVLFVAFVAAATGAIVYMRGKNAPPFFAGIAAAIILLCVAPAMLQTGESMEMLVAVLNTNFWLTVHVLCITSGYALSILTALLAHYYLVATLYKGKTLAALNRSLHVFSIAALLLTATGTALGGIWADQSWGRFWGWDPKENGALLIVLWIAWLQHGRLAGKLDHLSFAAGSAFLNIVVALAWFGVNLLGTGLHSYGFTQGIAAGLGAFCLVETLVIAGLWFYGRSKENSA